MFPVVIIMPDEDVLAARLDTVGMARPPAFRAADIPIHLCVSRHSVSGRVHGRGTSARIRDSLWRATPMIELAQKVQHAAAFLRMTAIEIRRIADHTPDIA